MTDLAIYGSCVTRDTIEFHPPAELKLKTYIARQSWISTGTHCEFPPFVNHHFQSRFMNRSFHGDLAGDALHRITATHQESKDLYLLIDLIDERGGYWVGPNGQIATFSTDAAGAGLYRDMPKDWRRVQLGSMEYGLSLLEASTQLQESLKELGLWERTAVLATRWAEQTSTGSVTPKSMGLSAEEANKLYDSYYEVLQTEGWTVLHPDIQEPTADASHRWGPAPFHFDDAYYRSLSTTIESFVMQ